MGLLQATKGKKTYTLSVMELLPFFLWLSQDAAINAFLLSILGPYYMWVSAILGGLTAGISKLTDRAK